MLIAGIDEAGRGSILGPMAMACVAIKEENEAKLVELGVRDSKELSPKYREELVEEIKKLVEEYAVILVQPEELNKLMEKHSLNEIEAMKAAQLISSLSKRPEMIIIDAPDVLAENFSERIKKYLPFNVVIKSEHFADKKYAIVSAASILAKVARDAAIKELEKKYGSLGSGYWHDERTRTFLEQWVKENKTLPEFARSKWEPSKKLINEIFQKKLGDFG